MSGGYSFIKPKRFTAAVVIAVIGLLLFFQNCGDVSVSTLASAPPAQVVVVNADQVKGTFCHLESVSLGSTYRLSNFYIVNLTANKFNGQLQPDNDLDGIIDDVVPYSNQETILISNTDSDEDGIPDFIEKLKGLNPNSKDADKDGVDLDGIINRRELQLGTDPSFTGDEPVIDYKIQPATHSDCGAGQPAYEFSIDKMHLVHTKEFTDTTNNPPYSFSHGNSENIIVALAKLSPDNTNKPSFFVAKFFILNASGLESRDYKPQDFFVLGEATDGCPDCSSGGTGNIYTKVFSGNKHTCALNDKNNAICWGDNSYGQLGDGTAAARVTPVNTKLRDKISSLALGGGHTCALTFDKEVQCWGANSFGQLGNNSTVDSLLPVKVNFGDSITPVHLVAGVDHTCVTFENNTVKCWGRNDSYQLGNGNTTASSVPVLSTLPAGITFPIVHASAAGNNNCMTDTSGKSYCWGKVNSCVQNAIGRVPNNCTSGTKFPNEPIRLTTAWSAIETNGFANSGIEKSVLGRLTCWTATLFAAGNHVYGCGAQEDGGSPIPDENENYPPSSEYTFGIERVLKIEMGLNHSCAISNKIINATTGEIRKQLDCWGENVFGALGQPVSTPTMNINPTTVSEVSEPKDISSGHNFSCAIDKNGSIWCWGANTFGQLGSGDIVDNATPTKVKNQ